MKKLFLLVVTTALVFCSSMNACAMTEAELQKKLTATYTVNGTEIKATSSQVAQIERYLQQNEVSSEDADFIAKKVDEAIAVMEAGNATSINELSKTEKDKIIAIVNSVSDKTDVKVTLSKGGVITVYNTDGTQFTKITDVIKYTDNNSIVMIASIISLVGILVVSRKISKVNA